MNLFRLLGDLSHLLSILILLHKMKTSNVSQGWKPLSKATCSLVRIVSSRHIIQKPSAIPYGLRHTISRYFHALSIPVPRPCADRLIDLFWTAFDPGSLYNTLFKVAYIASSSYIVYLMVNDYKPTHDPNIDTFKVQYLLAASAAMAIVLPNRFLYTPTEVRPEACP